VTGTCGEELTILALPSAWVWLRINDSKIKKNFSASMVPPRFSLGESRWIAQKFNHLIERARNSWAGPGLARLLVIVVAADTGQPGIA
jgi:hypothetical protein